ncbi:Melanoma-associated antigen 11 [Heterocephalus glaber]|uniref:Melanoma-associated antigen 11 n=1 Tax=Heterocephalus glaber TaxID=10181 RepID=G5BJ50_HETGA|nr:Melanoma-associated antigen 11 [Heterocephalus glaber]
MVVQSTSALEPKCGLYLTNYITFHCDKVSSQRSQSCEGSSCLQDACFSHILQDVLLNAKLCKLVSFLLHKYQKKEQVTMKEMLHVLPHDYCNNFPLNFWELCESIYLGFGIKIMKVNHSGNTYDLVPILGLTYRGILDGDDERIILKIDIIIFVLSLIFIEGNCISEEDLTQKVERWDMLDLTEKVKRWDMLAQSERIHFEEAWKFITEDLVQEEYPMYRQIPNSDSARYEFLWGPRAHAETSKMKLLVHMAHLNGTDLKSYPEPYEEALEAELCIEPGFLRNGILHKGVSEFVFPREEMRPIFSLCGEQAVF